MPGQQQQTSVPAGSTADRTVGARARRAGIAALSVAWRVGITAALGLLQPDHGAAQTQTYPCETVIQIGTGMSTNGAKLRPGSADPLFEGLGAIFPSTTDTFVLTDPPAAWINNASSVDSQWIGPSSSVADDAAGVYLYSLRFGLPCAGGTVTGRYAASDRASLRLNGAPVSFPTPAPGWTNWTAFTFNNLLGGINRLEFYITNSLPAAGGPPGPTGLRAELTATATCCPCIVLNCPSDLVLATCSTGATANVTITGTNRCYTNLIIHCSLASPTGVPVSPSTVYPPGTNTVFCSASDGAGHRTNCSFRVIVHRDSEPPQLRCPRDIVYRCSPGGTNVYYNITATDDRDPAPVVTCVPPSGSFFLPGTNTVNCTARDACGQISRCSFRVLIAPTGFAATWQAGIADDFSPGGSESAVPGPCLGGSGYWTGMPFDTSWPGRHLSASFPGLPADISAARLTLRLKPTASSSQDDVVRIGLQNCSLPAAWAWVHPVATLAAAGGAWTTNPPTTFTLDLAALPGGVNLIAALNAQHRLDFAVGTETAVDYARLEVTYCGPQTTLSGVPYSVNHAYPIHQSEGVSWQRLNSNGPPPTIAIAASGADGFRLNYPSILDAQRRCETVHPMTIVWPKPGSLTVTARILDIPVPGRPYESVFLEQPGNPIGKKIEVWNGNQLVSRHFFAGPGSTEADVPGDACVVSQGFAKDHYFVNFSSPQLIVLPAATAATRVTGELGPELMGTSVRLYFRPPVTLNGLGVAGQPVITFAADNLSLAGISLLHGNDWIEGFGSQQLTISDAIFSQSIPGTFFSPYGDCISLAFPSTDVWTLELNGVADFCSYPELGAPQCQTGYVDVFIAPQTVPFSGDTLSDAGGLRLTPTALPSDACHIQCTVKPAFVGAETSYSLTIDRTVGGPIALRNVSAADFSHWPLAVGGHLGLDFFNVLLPANTVVTVGAQNFEATGVTFHASPTFALDFAKVCLETTFLQQLSFKGFHATGTGAPSECLTLACPTNVMVDATNDTGASVTFSPAAATRCGSNVVITCEPPSGSFFPLGPSVVRCSAIDSLASQEDCSFTVTVNPPLRLRASAARPDQLELRWTGNAVVEFKDSLSPTTPWREVNARTESNGVERLILVAPTGDRRFFRLRSAP